MALLISQNVFAIEKNMDYRHRLLHCQSSPEAYVLVHQNFIWFVYQSLLILFYKLKFLIAKNDIIKRNQLTPCNRIFTPRTE